MDRRKLLLWSLVCLLLGSAGGIHWRRRWKYITIHHSAGTFGNISFLQKVHRQRQPSDPVDAIPYHFVIGNGNGMGLGEIASDWRYEYGIWGAHVSGNNADRNLRGIGICLIGNFEKQEVPKAQLDALVTLTRQLMKDFDIPAKNVTGHGYLPGESTRCPGNKFPMSWFMSEVARQQAG
ncbi:MAG: peptidoglycan recognition protein family protein [Gammaproteobacteria bacterium]